ncbi:MAG: hypothetical protein NTX56_19785 [Proteobacteria bacterium]|nr:hypothetical protein [Pseudomonadota bacterium]
MAGPDLSALSGVVSFDTGVEAVLLVASAWVVVVVAGKAVRMLKAAVYGGSAYDYYTYEEYSRDNEAAGLAVMDRAEWDKYNP